MVYLQLYFLGLLSDLLVFAAAIDFEFFEHSFSQRILRHHSLYRKLHDFFRFSAHQVFEFDKPLTAGIACVVLVLFIIFFVRFENKQQN